MTMGNAIHSVDVVTGSDPPQQSDRIKYYTKYGVANGAGGGAGLSVVVAVSVPVAAGLPSNGNYIVDIEASQDCTAFVSSKTATGFNVTLTPRLAANTLAAGTFNVQIMW
jgi:hypothetical protein